MPGTQGFYHPHSGFSGPNVIESQLIDPPAYQQALSFLYGRINYERMAGGSARYRFRPQGTDQLLGQLGLGAYLFSRTTRPKVPIIHIAGTKGKGSTAAMVAAALSQAGLKTGLYTSPHLHRLEERFQIDGQPCSSLDLVSLVAQIEPVTELVTQQAGRSPSFFELTTAIALLHFDTNLCDAMVLEVGLGGRLDSTNVCATSVTAITSIGLDHQHVLGETLSKIAMEKAGIYKRGIPMISGVAAGKAADVIEARAVEESSKLFRIGRDFSFRHDPDPDWGSQIEYQGMTPPLTKRAKLALSLDGCHQGQNASVALSIVDVLRDQGVDVDPESAIAGISSVQCPGRLERFELPHQVTAIVDSAHNIDSMQALCRCLDDRCGGRKIAVVFGTSRDKYAEPMLAQLERRADHLMLTRFVGNPRFTPPAELAGLMPTSARQTAKWDIYQQPIQACEAALEWVSPGGIVVVCGSFFLAAETREWFAAKAREGEAPAEPRSATAREGEAPAEPHSRR